MTISMPKITAANGQTLTSELMRSACCRNHSNPATTIITPMAMPTIEPPRGIPKHSRSYLL